MQGANEKKVINMEDVYKTPCEKRTPNRITEGPRLVTPAKGLLQICNEMEWAWNRKKPSL